MIELVFTLPIMLVLVIGSIDVCNNIFIKQFVTEVSYQGAVEGADAGISETDLQNSISEYLAARNIGDATIGIQGIDGTPYNDVGRGEMFEVIVNLASADRESPPVIIPHVDLNARSVGVRQ